MGVNREKLDSYSGPKVKLIMNGWYMHKPQNFPPTDLVRPVFMSFHVANSEIVDNNVPYFKEHEPIGCRDDYTRDLLKSHGVDAFTSKCMTLLLKSAKEPVKRHGIYMVDMPYWISGNRTDLKRRQEVMASIPQSILNRAVHTRHDVAPALSYSYAYKWHKAHALLKLYKHAELVITTRLHCALPCRAFGTPVIFLHPNLATDPRFKGLEHILRGADAPFDFEDLSQVVNIDAERENLTRQLLRRYFDVGDK